MPVTNKINPIKIDVAKYCEYSGSRNAQEKNIKNKPSSIIVTPEKNVKIKIFFFLLFIVIATLLIVNFFKNICWVKWENQTRYA